MVFCKVVKNRAYFSRYQVKYRRRREGKTDYGARRLLVKQDKDKYDSQKYRLVVRFTNKRIIAQIAHATIKGDIIISSADSTELPNYGIKVGLTNYAASYALGLLVARRTLEKFKMDNIKGNEKADGTVYHQEDQDNEVRPFKCILDVGIRTTTTGNRVFGVLKGAADGGLHVPHSYKRFPGYKKGEKSEGTYNVEDHRKRIFGIHVAEYMNQLQQEDQAAYKKQFSQYIKEGLTADDIEKMYVEAHKRIRESPIKVKTSVKKYDIKRVGNMIECNGKKYVRMKKLTCEQRKLRVKQKLHQISLLRAQNSQE